MYKMKTTLIILILSLIGIFGIKYGLPYLEEDECNTLLAQYKEFKDKGWYATRSQAETCKNYNIILPVKTLSRMYEIQ